MNSIMINSNILFNQMNPMINQINNLNLNQQLSINDFIILGNLGEGKHGSVEKVKYLKDNQLYALKMIKQSSFINTKTNQINQEKEIDYFREIYILKDLNNKINLYKNYVIKFYGNFQDNNYRYLFVELVEGKSLDKLRKEHQEKNEYIPQETIIQIFQQLLMVLMFLHDECNIIHRDIKPENIILDKNNNIKLLDFGLAVYLNHIDTRLKSRMSFKGSRHYVPPEVLFGKFLNYDYKYDIFCLGFTMYNIMNPNDIGDRTNLPQNTDSNNQRTANINTNTFYDDWLMELIKTLYSQDPNSRPTAKYALQILESSKFYPRRFPADIRINKNCNNLIKRVPTGLEMARNNMDINTGFNIEINRNLKKRPTDVQNLNHEEFLQPNQGLENKIITSMKSLIYILSNLQCMEMIKCQFHSIFNNTEQKTFMESFYNILNENNIMVKDPSYKDVYERKINDFIREVVINNRENINGPRPIILFYMMSSIVKFEFIKFSPNYENNILGANLLTLNNYPFNNIVPKNYDKLSLVINQINFFKKNNRSPFVDNFYFIGLSIEKCPNPDCGNIYDVEVHTSQLLQLTIEQKDEKIDDLINKLFAENFPESALICNKCNSLGIISKQFFCLNLPEYLLLEFEDKNKIKFKTEISIPLYNEEVIKYKFIGAIYKKKIESYSKYFAVIKKNDNIILYDDDKIEENCNIDKINSENPSLAFYQKIKLKDN